MADLVWILGIAAYVLLGVAFARWCREEMRKDQASEREYREMLDEVADEHLANPAAFGRVILTLAALLWPLGVVTIIVFTVQDNRAQAK